MGGVGRATHHYAVQRILYGTILQVRTQIDRNRPAPVVPCHALHTTSNADVDRAGLDCVRYVRDRLEAGGTLAVDGIEAGRVREASMKHGHASGFGAAEFLQDGADGEVFD